MIAPIRLIPTICLFAQFILGISAELPAAEKWNVLFIGIDDLRTDLGCYGANQIQSPNIDRLAKRGTLFQRAYCQQAVCNPSRASLLTGLSLQTLGIYDLPTHFRERRPDIVTLPQHFKRQGYFCQNIGKIFHNWRQDDYKGDPKSWSVPAELHYNTHGADKALVEGTMPPNLSTIPKCVIRDVPDNAYFDGRVAERAAEALQEIQDRPFFLAVGFWKPHAHFNAPKKYWDLYDRNTIKPPTPINPPSDVPEIALHDGREIRRDFKSRPNQTPTPSDTLALRHGYYAAVSYMDAQVGKAIDELDRLGLTDKTVIVLWSDHGYHLGEHGLWAKTSNFELDARVPLIISTPDHREAQVSDSLTELLDLYPTITELCRLPKPKHLEGKSLKPILDDPAATVRDIAITQHPRPAYSPPGKKPLAMGYSIRTDRYRYTEWRKFGTSSIIARELYDHREDQHETQNLAGKPGQNQIVKRLHQTLSAAIVRPSQE